MERNFTKEYIEISIEYRKSNGSKETIEKLYDLLYELEKVSRTKNDDLALSNIYTLLGFHQSAYEVFKSVADLTNRKNTTKLYVLEEKAKSHKNDFIIKDIRQARAHKGQTKLLQTDFVESEGDKNTFAILNKSVIIFNKSVSNDKIEIHVPDNKIASYTDKIIGYIYWLGDCKSELVEYYNNWDWGYIEKEADDDWYDTLEIYSVRITIGKNDCLYSEISAGDEYNQDHLLDIETDTKTIRSMNYDG